MPTPTHSDLYVDPLLTDFSVGIEQTADAFISNRVFPVKEVDLPTGKYPVFDRGELYRDRMAQRRDQGTSPRVGWAESKSSYDCEDFWLGFEITDRQRRASAAAYGDLELNATRNLTHADLIHRDVHWVTNFFTTSVWTTDKTGGTDFVRFDDYGASDPVNVIADYLEDAEDLTGLMPNKMVMSRHVWTKVKNHPDVLSRLGLGAGATTGSPAQASLQAVAGLFEVDEIMVARAVYNTAGPGETASYSRIAGNHILLVYVDESPGIHTPTAGVTFAWNATGAAAAGRRIKRYREEPEEQDVIEIQTNHDMQVTSADLGLFMSGVTA